MRTHGDQWRFSPTDLSAYLACPHLTTLQLAVARGELEKPFRVNRHADLIRRKGEEHEAAYIAKLRAEGRDVVEIPFEHDWEAAALATEDAIREGAGVVYQAVLMEGNWRGKADFVERLPDGSYEVVDTKLARHARPAHVLQLCFYTEQVGRIQGRLPERMHVVAGTTERETFRPGDYDAYYRRVRRRFLDAVEHHRDSYPYPVEHCGLCEFLALCQERWEADDHLTLVAGVSRLQVERLEKAGITTLERLAVAAPDTPVPSMRQATFDKVRHQAELQLHRRRTGEHRVDLLPLEPERGFALMPEPDPGDIWLDLEGDPWFEPARGLEYLLGWLELAGNGEPRYECIWAHDRAGERRAFERFVDFLIERRRRFPRMHVYHYAPYERTALTRLMGEHGTREAEIDELLRGEALVDLYRVTRQALRASLPRYSIKDVEALYGFERHADVGGGSESVEDFELWLEVGDDTLLEGIREYNREDCLSLYELHRWLLAQRPEELEWRKPPEERERSEESQERDAERAHVRDRLLAGAEEGDPRWLMAQLLYYHQREERPQWWEYFFHRGLDDDEYVTNRNTLGGLVPDGEPWLEKKSWWYRFRFEAQEHKIHGSGVDPKTERKFEDVRVDDEHGTVELRWGREQADVPLPTALIPPQPLYAKPQRAALLRLAEKRENYPAALEVLERRRPRARLDGTLEEAALSLDGSYLFVQGPPGSGKTWNGARMAIALMKAGQRVGVTALSHKAIHKFLDDLEQAAIEVGYEFRGRKKGSGEGHYEGRFVDCTNENDDMRDPELQLIAGTSWLFARDDQHVDTLFVDEGGQFALADALAVGTAARNLIFLGDPNQLPQVSQGAHPPGASASVLQHLLGDDETVRPEMGIFLGETWRMRPEVNAFISEAFYEGRLGPARVCFERSIADGNGLRFLAVPHSGHSQASPEEADAVAAEIARLVGTPYVDEHGARELRPDDFVVVSPYNAHVRCLREKIRDERVQIGTVDKFQGQQAPVVFFSMASSSGEDVPRGIDFLFSRNRLNVAISRAKCLAYVVASPRLLEVNCRTVEQMPLVNALCRFVELAQRDD